MNRNRWIAPALLTLALPVTAYAQTRTTVNAQTLATQPAGTPYVLSSGIDTRVFTVTPDILSRVQLPTASSTVPMSTVAMKLRASGSPILVGTFTNLSAIDFGFTSTGTARVPTGGTTTAVKCGGGVCSCTGKIDCRDMGLAKVCVGGANRNWWACDSKGCVCLDKNDDNGGLL